MRILGIDPGLKLTGYGIIEWTGPDHPLRPPGLVDAGVIRLDPKASLPSRLHERVEGRGRDGVAADAVAGQVDDDRRQPRAEPQLADPLRLVAAEGAICPDERVLGHLLGVVRVAQHAQGDRVAPVHVRLDEVLERAVEVTREAFGELGVIHHGVQPAGAACGCICDRS